MAREHLLPGNSTALERAVSEAADRIDVLTPGIAELRSFKYDTPQASILPWLIVEYGLGPISPYLPDEASVIAYGIRWQRLKGTPEGISEALSWIGYAFDAIYEMPPRRRRWHLFEIELDRFRDSETDLDRIEAVGRLTQPARSLFWRGYREHNVREADWSHTRWGHAIWSDCSGVRLHDGGVKWSFGRTFEPVGGSHSLTEAELTEAGAWIEPADEGGSIGWGAFPWTTPDLKWTSDGATTRAGLIATTLLGKSCWIGLYDEDGEPIGFRRARAYHPVVQQIGGYYRAGANSYVAGPAGARIYVEAMTGFGEGEGGEPRSWKIILGAELPDGQPAGKQWLEGADLAGGSTVGSFAIAPGILLNKTTRERFRAILKIEAS